jgi:hypothetical protein
MAWRGARANGRVVIVPGACGWRTRQWTPSKEHKVDKSACAAVRGNAYDIGIVDADGRERATKAEAVAAHERCIAPRPRSFANVDRSAHRP